MTGRELAGHHPGARHRPPPATAEAAAADRRRRRTAREAPAGTRVEAAVVSTTWSPTLSPSVISTALSPRSPIVIERASRSRSSP